MNAQTISKIHKSGVSGDIRRNRFGYLQLICMIVAIWSLGSLAFARDDLNFAPAFSAANHSPVLIHAAAADLNYKTGARYGIRAEPGVERTKSFGGGAAPVEILVDDGVSNRCRPSLRDLCRTIENAEFQFNPVASVLPASSDLKPKSIRISKSKVVVHYTFR